MDEREVLSYARTTYVYTKVLMQSIKKLGIA